MHILNKAVLMFLIHLLTERGFLVTQVKEKE